MKAFVPAAGLGTRLKEETLDKPKALVLVGGKTLLQHALEKLQKDGIDEVVVNVHHFSGMIMDFVRTHDFGIPVRISDETKILLDTGGGLKKAAPLLSGDEPVLIWNVDVLSNINIREMARYHIRSGALATLAVRSRETFRYFCFNENKRLVGWRNRQTGEVKIAVPGAFEKAVDMAFSGIHMVNPGIFNLMPEKDRFSITDLYLELAGQHLISGYFDESDRWTDVGKSDQLAEARRLTGL